MKWVTRVSVAGCIFLLGLIGWMVRAQSRYHPPAPPGAALAAPARYGGAGVPVQGGTYIAPRRAPARVAPERVRGLSGSDAQSTRAAEEPTAGNVAREAAGEVEYMPTVRAPSSPDEYAAPQAPITESYGQQEGAEGYEQPATSRERSEEAQAPAADTVHITNSGTKYHKAGCRYLSKSDIPISRSEAEEQGYTACSICKP